MYNVCVSLFKEQTQKCGDVIFRPFDPVTVQLSLDRSNVQHEKIVLKLVHPQVNVISFFFFAFQFYMLVKHVNYWYLKFNSGDAKTMSFC
jgi:hypothetical protein